MAIVNTVRAWNSLVLNVDAAPDVSGVRAGLDSLAITQYGAIYKKTGVLDTDWTLLTDGLGPSTPSGQYGDFYSSQTQTSPTPNSPNLMTFNNTNSSNGISIVANSQITAIKSGVYDIQFSAQVSTTTGSDKELFIWLKKNGTNVPYSNTQVDIQGGSKKAVVAWNFFVALTAGQYAEIAWLTSDGNMTLLQEPENLILGMPAIPSIILTVNEVAGL